MPLIQERIKLLSEVPMLTDFFFTSGTLQYTRELLLGKRLGAEPQRACEALQAVLDAAAAVPAWTALNLEAAIEPLTERLGLKKGDLYGLIRVAISGKTVAPPLFESMEVLGRERTLARLRDAEQRLVS